MLLPSFKKKMILDLYSICQIFLIKTPCLLDMLSKALIVYY
ncbi:hypothetical protein NEOC65_001866 [Neochlamydia sp. AcF65]|nr:hypothetical protein [Neochlamydia sp. AcF65]